MPFHYPPPPPKGPYHAPEYDVCEFEDKPCGLCVNCTMPQADPMVRAVPLPFNARVTIQWATDKEPDER